MRELVSAMSSNDGGGTYSTNSFPVQGGRGVGVNSWRGKVLIWAPGNTRHSVKLELSSSCLADLYILDSTSSSGSDSLMIGAG